MPHATLYRIYDGNEQLLYVGISISPSRYSQHSTKNWWGEARFVVLEHFDTREQGVIAEERAIEAENPLYNIKRAGMTPKQAGEAKRRAAALASAAHSSNGQATA